MHRLLRASFVFAFVLAVPATAVSAPPGLTAASNATPARALPSPVLARFKGTKARVDPAKIAAVFTTTGAKASMRLKSGKSVTLDPLASMTVTANTTAPAELAKYKTHFDKTSFEPLAEQPVIIALAQDHSARQTPVKDQMARGSCVAFAISGAMESYLSWKKDLRVDISEEHMFKLFKDSTGGNCNDYGFNFNGAAAVLHTKKVCSETSQPYAAPSPCVISPACSGSAGFGLDKVIVVPGTAAVPGSNFIASNTRVLESFIDAGYDVSIGVGVAGTGWHDNADTGIIDVQVKADGTPADSTAGHALDVVGYDRAGGYFILKNSWGTDWGRSGYGRISYDYLQTYAAGALVVLEASRAPTIANAIAPANPHPVK